MEQPVDESTHPRNLRPDLRNCFKLGNMPYEFNEYDIINVISELLHLGATEISIRRYITDDNESKVTVPNQAEPPQPFVPAEFPANSVPTS